MLSAIHNLVYERSCLTFAKADTADSASEKSIDKSSSLLNFSLDVARAHAPRRSPSRIFLHQSNGMMSASSEKRVMLDLESSGGLKDSAAAGAAESAADAAVGRSAPSPINNTPHIPPSVNR